uniref:Sodium/potassium-transporting ATPase subunit beta n=1 Tax=Monopterus albus TaxID=43700 RepID=A0A3Q3K4M7_MONAL
MADGRSFSGIRRKESCLDVPEAVGSRFSCSMSFSMAAWLGSLFQAMLLTLSNYKPTWQDRVAPPGLTHTPQSDKTEFSFNLNDVASYLPYVKDMKEFLAKYDDEHQRDDMKFQDCGDEPAEYRNRGNLESDVGIRKACRFSRSLLGPCSGIEDREFGFKEGKPCLIVKLNRIVNFWPRPPSSNDSIPEGARPKVQPNVIPIYCTSKYSGEPPPLRTIMRMISLHLGQHFVTPGHALGSTHVIQIRGRMLVKLGRLCTMVLVAASPCSTTPTMASCSTLSTCSRW